MEKEPFRIDKEQIQREKRMYASSFGHKHNESAPIFIWQSQSNYPWSFLIKMCSTVPKSLARVKKEEKKTFRNFQKCPINSTMPVKTKSNQYLLRPPFTFKTESIISGTLSCSFIRKPAGRLIQTYWRTLPQFFSRF